MLKRHYAALPKPEICEFLEAQDDPLRIRLPANRVLQDMIGYLPVESEFTRFFAYVVARIVQRHQKLSYPGNVD
jgi:hypothetical protein